LRTGWMICQDKDLIMDAVILRENSSEIMNIMGEVIAEIALREGRYETALKTARAEGRANLKTLSEFVDQQPQLSWSAPQGGLIGLARVRGEKNGDQIAKALLEAPYKTFLLPGSAYDHPHHIRLGVGGGTAAHLTLGLSRLATYLNSLGEHRNGPS